MDFPVSIPWETLDPENITKSDKFQVVITEPIVMKNHGIFLLK